MLFGAVHKENIKKIIKKIFKKLWACAPGFKKNRFLPISDSNATPCKMCPLL
jgi:hypothetical protein